MHKHSIESQGATEGMVDYDRNSSAQQSIILTKEEQIRSLVRKMADRKATFRIMDAVQVQVRLRQCSLR